VDRSTDIWSFGCLLYEMLSGERAFRGGSGFDVVASVLRDEVAWAKLPARTPASVQRLIRRCLEKSAAARPQGFSEIRQVLEEAAGLALSGPRFLAPPARSWRPVLIAAGLAFAIALAAMASLQLRQRRRAAAAEPRQVRVAVLPFRSLDPGDADEYLADGLTEDLISQLGRVQPARLTVIARHSAMTYKGSHKQIDEIARELPVQYVVDGSVRRQDEELRITSRLVRVSDQATLWTESYDRRMGDLLALQGEVAEEIARRIRISVAPPGSGARAVGGLAPAAYDAYLRGRYHQQRGSAASTARALEEFEESVALEPGFALAWAGLSRARIFSSRTRPTEAQALARQAALEAVKLDGSSSEARIALGLVRLYADWDWEGARRELESAVALDPGSPEGHFYLAQALGAAGALDDAVASARRAKELDPFSPLIRHYVGRFFYYQRDYDAAILEYRQAIDLDPGYPWSELFLSLTLEQTGRDEESLRHRQRALSLMGTAPGEVQELGEVFERGGYEGVLRQRAADVEARTRELGYVTSTELAQVWLRLGEEQRALDWLERAFEDHTRDLIYVGVEPAFDSLRDEPRFEALLSRMGHPAVAAEPAPAG
jgi:TolB-like protein/Tfp pilus assembly protein PilF